MFTRLLACGKCAERLVQVGAETAAGGPFELRKAHRARADLRDEQSSRNGELTCVIVRSGICII